MTPNAASPAAIAVFNRVLTEFQQELSMDEVDDFTFITADDLKKAVHQLQEEQKSKKRMQNLRRISAFLEAMDQFDKVIQVFLNTTNYLGFIWVSIVRSPVHTYTNDVKRDPQNSCYWYDCLCPA